MNYSAKNVLMVPFMIYNFLFTAKPPKFEKKLSESTGTEGHEMILSVTVSGFPKPEVTWFLDGLPVRNDMHHRITESGQEVTLTISPAMIDDEGVYTVKAANALGSTLCQAEVIVQCK